MTPTGKTVLTISRGTEYIFEKEGIFNIWSYLKDGDMVVAIRDEITEEVIVEDLPCTCVNANAPYVQVHIEEG